MRNSLVYLVIVITVIAVFFWFFNDPLGGSQEIPISEVIHLAENPPAGGQVVIEVRGNALTI